MPGRKPVTICTDGEWRRAIEHMRAVVTAPEGYHFVFRRSAKLNVWGDCCVNEQTKTITIRVARNVPLAFAEWILMHEVAHALDWSPMHAHYSDHGPTFGVRWAVVYCAYMGERH